MTLDLKALANKKMPSEFWRRIGFVAHRFLRSESEYSNLDAIDRTKDLFIYHHLGLGDMIHCNGMVRYLLSVLEPNRSIHVFCKERNSGMVAWMYRDEPRVVLELIPDGMRERPFVRRLLRKNGSSNLLVVGHRNMRALEAKYPNEFFDVLFYKQVGLPYELRFSKCYWQRDRNEEERVYSKLTHGDEYIFVHDDPSRGYAIDRVNTRVRVVKNDTTESIFHLGLVLERAKEVHCMESSIRCMIESLNMNNVKLFYHDFRYPERPLGDATCQDWETIHYPQKVAA